MLTLPRVHLDQLLRMVDECNQMANELYDMREPFHSAGAARAEAQLQFVLAEYLSDGTLAQRILMHHIPRGTKKPSEILAEHHLLHTQYAVRFTGSWSSLRGAERYGYVDLDALSEVIEHREDAPALAYEPDEDETPAQWLARIIVENIGRADDEGHGDTFYAADTQVLSGSFDSVRLSAHAAGFSDDELAETADLIYA